MPHHESLLNDPIGTLRGIWGDSAWRFTLIASALVFLLETIGELANVDQPTIWWFAEIVTIVIIARILTMRPLRGRLTDTDNMTVVLSVLGLLIVEAVLSWSTVITELAAEPIYWPISLVLILTLVAARLLAPIASRPLVVWVLVFSFFQFWMNAAIWYSDVSFPSPTFMWAVSLIFFAFIARWIAGGGIGGPIVSALNAAFALFVIFDLWLEFGIAESGAGDSWISEDIYWPWILVNSGLAIFAALLAPRVAAFLGGDGRSDP